MTAQAIIYIQCRHINVARAIQKVIDPQLIIASEIGMKVENFTRLGNETEMQALSLDQKGDSET